MLRIPGRQKLSVPVTFPTVLSRSRDYNAVELLFSSIFDYFYTLSVESKNVHNPRRCSNDLLPLLAEFYRYEFSDVKDINKEREIIATVPELHHNKGTATGIENALALSKIDNTDGLVIPWFYDKEKNHVIVIIFNTMRTYKLIELLRLVVPLGTKIILKPGFSIKSSEEMKFHSWTEVNFGELQPNKAWYVTPNNTWYTKWDPEKKLYHTYVDYQAHIGNDDMDIQIIGNNGEIENGKSKNTAGTRVGNTEIASNDKTPEQTEE